MLQVAHTPMVPWPLLPHRPCGVWPGQDPELERLRRLQERTRIEEEKEALRQWLRRHGVSEHQICPCHPLGMPWALPQVTPLGGGSKGPTTVSDVLKRIK